MAKNKDKNAKNNNQNQSGKNRAEMQSTTDVKGDNKKGQNTQNRPAGTDSYT